MPQACIVTSMRPRGPLVRFLAASPWVCREFTVVGSTDGILALGTAPLAKLSKCLTSRSNMSNLVQDSRAGQNSSGNKSTSPHHHRVLRVRHLGEESRGVTMCDPTRSAATGSNCLTPICGSTGTPRRVCRYAAPDRGMWVSIPKASRGRRGERHSGRRQCRASGRGGVANGALGKRFCDRGEVCLCYSCLDC